MAGYTRQDTANNIANGKVIDADDLDGEFNAVETAFNASSGHVHDGTSGNGAPITKVGPSQDLVVSSTSVLPKTTNTLDVGSSGAQFKDANFNGVIKGGALQAGINGYTVIGDNLYAVTGDLRVDASGDLTIDVDGGDVLLKDGGTTWGGLSNNSGNLIVKSGTTTAATFTGANVDLAGTLDVTGAATLDSTLGVTGLATLATVDVNGGAIDGTVIGANSAAAITGTTITGTSLVGPLTGNASTATALATARSITIDGDVDASATNFDGTGNITLTTTLDTVNSNVGSFGSATAIPVLTVNAKGLVTAASTAAITTTLTVGADSGSNDTVALADDTLTFAGTTNEIETTVSNNQIQIGLPDNVTVGGNLIVSGNMTVSGTTTTVNTETINLADNQIVLNSNETGTPSQNGGIEIERGTSANKTFVWNESTDKWTVGSETLVAGTFEGALSGNATTATTLATARTIAGQSFDGSGNISIAPTDLTGVTSTASELNILDGVTSTTAELNILDGVTSTAAELNLLDGSTANTVVNSKAVVYGSSGEVQATTVDLGDWTITQSGSDLKFAYQGTDRLKLTSAGALTVEGDVTASGSA